MDADVSFDPHGSHNQVSAFEPPNRLIWTLITAMPVISAFAWAEIASRTQQLGYLFTAGIYLLWPVVTLIIGLIGAAVMEMHPTGEEAQGYYIVLGFYVWIATIVGAQRTWKQWRAASAAQQNNQEHPTFNPVPNRTCFLLWLCLGWLGAHRFYSGRWISGLMYAGSLGAGGIGWAADLFVLPFLTEYKPDWQEQTEVAAQGEHGGATWAVQPTRFGWIDFAFRLIFFLMMPLIFVVVCIMLQHYELLAVAALVLVVCGLLGNVEGALKRLEPFERTPVLGDALSVFTDLYKFYRQNKPRSFMFYWFYPLSVMFSARSPQVRREAWLFFKILQPVLLVIVVQQVVTYQSTYPPHLGVEEAFVRAVVLSLFAAWSTAAFIIPTVTTSFALNLSGRQWQLKFLALICLAIAIPGGIFTVYEQSDKITFLAADLLGDRMKKSSFRDELHESSEMFLAYHVSRLERDETRGMVEDVALTEKYRRHIGGIALNDEVHAFSVFTIALDEFFDHEQWLGVRAWYGDEDKPPNVLFLMSPDGRMHTTWSELPEAIGRQFEAVTSFDPDVDAAPRRVASLSLIGDLY